jgi:hypothetical protein
VLQYFFQGGSVALAFLILGLLTSVPAAYLTYLRRIGSLWRVPDRFASCRKDIVAPILHVLSSIFFCVAWGHYVGQTAGSYNEEALRRVILFDDLAGILRLQTPSLSAGFGCTVAAFVFSSAAAVLTFMYRQEISRTDPPGGAGQATAVAGNAFAMSAGNAVTAAAIGEAYGSATVSEWGGNGAGAAAGFSTVPMSPVPTSRGDGFPSGYPSSASASASASLPGALPPSMPAASHRPYSGLSAGGSDDVPAQAPPLPPKGGRGAAVLLAQGQGRPAVSFAPELAEAPPSNPRHGGSFAMTSGAASTRNFAQPPPLPDEDEADDAAAGRI